MLAKTFVTLYFISITLVFFTHPFDGNGDFYHHINTGKYIVENHSLPYVDNLTFSREGKPWIPYAWGSGLMLYIIFTAFGPWGITVWVSLTAFLTFWLLYKLLKSYGLSDGLNLLLLTLAIAPLAIRWPARPEIVAYPLMIVILLIDRLRLRRPKFIWGLPLIILVWANLYGSSVFVGMGLIGLLAGRQLVTDRFKIAPKLRGYYIVSILAILTSLINPYGLRSIFYLYLVIPKIAHYEGEWAGIATIFQNAPVSYLITTQYLFLIYFLFLLTYLITVIFGYRKLPANWFTFALSFLVFLPIVAFRHTPLAAIMALPFMAVIASSLTEKAEKILVFILIIISFISLGFLLWLKPAGFSSDDSAITSLNAFITKYKLSGNAFNYQAVGGYLSYYFYPQIKIYYDTRDDLFVESAVFNDLYETLTTGSSVIPLLNKYKADLVIGDLFTDSLNYKGLYYSPDWQIAYFNDRYFVAVRKTLTNNSLPNLNFIDPYSTSMTKGGMEAATENYFKQLVLDNPKSVNDRMYLAAVYFAQKKYDDTIRIINEVEVPAGPLRALYRKNLNYLLGLSYFEKKDCSKANFYFELTAKDIKHKIIFSPSKELPNNLSQGLSYHYIYCEREPQKAQTYLDQFLAQPEVTPLEKVKTEQRFAKLKSDF